MGTPFISSWPLWVGQLNLIGLIASCGLIGLSSVAHAQSKPSPTSDTIQRLENPQFKRAVEKILQTQRAFYEATPKDILHFFSLTGQEKNQIRGGFYSFSPDGQRLILKTRERSPSFSLFDLAGKELAPLSGEAPNFSPNGQWFYTIEPNFIQVYSSTNGHRVAQIQGSLPTFTANSSALMVYSETLHTTVLYGSTGQVMTQVPGLLPTISPDGQRFTLKREAKTLGGLTSSGNSALQATVINGSPIEFNADSTRLLTVEAPHWLSLLDRTGTSLARFQGFPPFTGGNAELLSAFSPNGNLLIVTALDRRSSLLYDATSGQKIAELSGVFAGVSPNSKRIVTVTADLLHNRVKTTNLYNSQGKRLAIFTGTFNLFSPNSQTLLTFLSKQSDPLALPLSGKFQLFDSNSGQKLGHIPGIFDPLQREGEKSPTFSPNGARIITLSQEGKVLLFDAGGKPLAQFQGSFEGFNRNGQYFILRTGRIFQLFNQMGQMMAQATGDYSQFSPDGRLWMVASHP